MKVEKLKTLQPGILGIVAILTISIITMSFQDTPFVNQIIDSRNTQDTIPEKYDRNNTMTMDEFDKMIIDLDETKILADMKDIEIDLKDLNLDRIEEQVELSLSHIDMDKIMLDVEKSLSSIDLSEIMKDIQISIHDENGSIDTIDLKRTLADARQELEAAKGELGKIDKEQLKKELRDAKVEIDNARIEIKKIDMDKIRKEASEGIKEAKEELQLMRQMFDEMEKDGLINKSEGFSFEFKNEEIYLNGVKQSKKVTEKYKKYIEDNDVKITIEKKK